jgi:hypothetical protein
VVVRRDPSGVRFADKCVTSYSLDGETAAFNDIGIMTWPSVHTLIVAVFLSASQADKTARDALFAEIGENTSLILPVRPTKGHSCLSHSSFKVEGHAAA